MPINTVAVFDDIFTPAELDMIAATGDGLVQAQATITSDAKPDPRQRITRVGWMTPGPDHAALFRRLSVAVQRLNAQFFRFDIKEIEPLQYTVYEGAEGGHYGWHVDAGPNTPKPRKLSLSLQLSDPASYEGCDLEFQFGPNIDTAPRRRGALIAFPSFYLHRVTPILSGTRRALVIWANGPEFR